MGNCKDCKYWRKQRDKHRKCIEITAKSKYEVLDDKPYLAGDDPLWTPEADLFTPPDFGCVLFEQKERK